MDNITYTIFDIALDVVHIPQFGHKRTLLHQRCFAIALSHLVCCFLAGDIGGMCPIIPILLSMMVIESSFLFGCSDDIFIGYEV